MAINFPNSPSNGDVFGNFTYDTSIPGWRKTPENSASLPAGTIVQWPGATAPANWLLADGAAVSRTTYASLFAAIGIQYGSGDGTTTFNLPNLKGKVAVGLDSSQTEFNTLGETGGAKTHTLTESEMPSHTHVQNSHNHTQDAHNHTQNPHNHSTNTGEGYGGVRDTAYGGGDGYKAHYYTPSLVINNTTATNNATTATNQATTATNQNTGGGGAHNNLQPYIVLNYIIKTSAGITSSDSELATRVGVVETAVRSVPLGGTGSSTFTSGSYLKGAGTSAITAQSGIPAGDITSGTLAYDRFPAGTIVQVVSGTYAGAEIGNSSSTYVSSGLSVDITPRYSNSLIFIQVSQNYLRNVSYAANAANVWIRRGTTNIKFTSAWNLGSTATEMNGPVNFSYVDAPATTASTNYNTVFANNVNGPVIVANRGMVATMILMEIRQ